MVQKRISYLAAAAVCSLLLCPTTHAKSSYNSRIPNGSKFSCNSCHTANVPALNSFGSAFRTNSRVWNAALAAADADKDGFTNGLELADPNGTWVQGSANPAGTVTNPGDASSKPTVAAPTITAQPASQTVTAGANASFTVQATGTGTLSFQWQKDGGNLAGATSATLNLTAVTPAQAGAYRVVVSNAGGSVTSSAATLTVNTPAVPPTLSVALADGSLRITIAGQSGARYRVEHNALLGSGPWTQVGETVLSGTTGEVTVPLPTAGQAGFYRAVAQ
jgi:hypothetical protein